MLWLGDGVAQDHADSSVSVIENLLLLDLIPDIRETSKAVNTNLMKLIGPEDDLDTPLDEVGDIEKIAEEKLKITKGTEKDEKIGEATENVKRSVFFIASYCSELLGLNCARNKNRSS
jgi:hypothetical protein